MIIICKYLVPRGYQGLTLFPFIFLKSRDYKQDTYLINHERIHLRQQLELLIVFFYLWYLIEFVWYYFKTNDIKVAYRSIVFEREAYQNEYNLNYLTNRRFFAYIRN